MTQFPEDIKFKYAWRKYQQRVLDELQDHLSDDHLHVIAPPGSGKTILGLEVAIRLNKPTLILAPTLAIRNQWIQRFCELFLQTNQIPIWISKDIRNPKFMTVVTYQGLHAACNNQQTTEAEIEEYTEEELEDVESEKSTNSNIQNIIAGLKNQNIKTIVVDEAHHLKNEWWHTLNKIKVNLKPIIVGLTATPPYDVSPNEWQRYIELNGPVDTEISVPELVIEGDLCPHQDYIHFTIPTEKENETIKEFRITTEKLFQEIKKDEILIQAIENHPIWVYPSDNLDWIYSNISYYSACLIFLNDNQREITESHLEIIGEKEIEIPSLDYKWLETILDFYLYKEKVHFSLFEEHKKSIENKLRRYGVIEKKQIRFDKNKLVTQSLTSSLSKLNGIKEIVDFEHKQLGSDLRMVILSDYIRKEFFVNTQTNTLELNKIGIIPIFEKLRRENIENKKIGVLTGSIIIIPKSAFLAFETMMTDLGLPNFSYSEIPYDANYILIDKTEQIKNDIIHIITQLFQNGKIEVLIGTKSLLGEGWDAPAINSLILASFVGSFVLSNQMRGRAIRTQQGNPNKTGNIWHLVTLDKTIETGGEDFDLLKRRFRGFVGISFKELTGIENGINRLNLPLNFNENHDVESINNEMYKFAGERGDLKQKWQIALETGYTLIEEIKIPFEGKKEYSAVKSMYFNKTIKYLLATLASYFIAFGYESLQILGRAARHIKSIENLYFYLAFIGTIGILFFGGFTIKTLRLFLKYRDIAKDIQQIGDALLNTLMKIGTIHSEQLKVISTVDRSGAIYCHLDGGTTYEKSAFINALQEIITTIDNPRYIIIRKNKFMFWIKQRDYHAVPETIGRNKIQSEYFESQWSNIVGRCELVFTRTLEGRQILLKSRIQSLAAQFEDKIEHVNKWR